MPTPEQRAEASIVLELARLEDAVIGAAERIKQIEDVQVPNLPPDKRIDAKMRAALDPLIPVKAEPVEPIEPIEPVNGGGGRVP